MATNSVNERKRIGGFQSVESGHVRILFTVTSTYDGKSSFVIAIPVQSTLHTETRHTKTPSPLVNSRIPILFRSGVLLPVSAVVPVRSVPWGEI